MIAALGSTALSTTFFAALLGTSGMAGATASGLLQLAAVLGAGFALVVAASEGCRPGAGGHVRRLPRITDLSLAPKEPAASIYPRPRTRCGRCRQPRTPGHLLGRGRAASAKGLPPEQPSEGEPHERHRRSPPGRDPLCSQQARADRLRLPQQPWFKGDAADLEKVHFRFVDPA